MRIYLAGPSREIARVREVAAQIVAAGHTLTSTWHERDVPPSDAPIGIGAMAEAWTRNAAGILDADRVIALACTGGGLSQGVREEVAYALGLYERDYQRPYQGCAVFIVGDAGPSLALSACVHVRTVGEALR